MGTYANQQLLWPLCPLFERTMGIKYTSRAKLGRGDKWVGRGGGREVRRGRGRGCGGGGGRWQGYRGRGGGAKTVYKPSGVGWSLGEENACQHLWQQLPHISRL